MDYYIKIVKILENSMTERGFRLWEEIDKILPTIWKLPTSSTRKHHRKSDGRVPDIAEHTYEMLYSFIKIMRMFDYKSKTTDADTILLTIALHDSLKYGQCGTQKHTDGKHDYTAGNMIKGNKDTFEKLLNPDQYNILEEGVRYHSGQWSTDVGNIKAFNWIDYKPTTLFVHILDMLSSQDLLKTDEERGNNEDM